jgi:hypothetical protein
VLAGLAEVEAGEAAAGLVTREAIREGADLLGTRHGLAAERSQLDSPCATAVPNRWRPSGWSSLI